jgi:hypothetical protein
MDMMVISSYGEVMEPSVDVVAKGQDTQGLVVAARQELSLIIDTCRDDRGVFLRDVCPDWPGAQLSKEDHMKRIKNAFEKNTNEGVLLWYAGHGERDTGNWCFKDGVITFHDIYKLYMELLKGKRLTIVSDCSYSGQWIKDCAVILDQIHLPSCGHYTRAEGLLLKIFTSCSANEERLSLMSCVSEAIQIDHNKGCLVFLQKKLSSGNSSKYGDFMQIRCNKPMNESCEVTSSWVDRVCKYPLVYLVHGEDESKEAWYYVLIDEDKVNLFESDLNTDIINLEKYGKILYSAYGKNPPQSITHKIQLQYSTVETL